MPVVSHPDVREPEDAGAAIWRYMDFTKFVAMLENRALYFATIGELQKDDPFEGSFLPSRLLADQSKLVNLDDARAMIRSIVPGVCVNCWHTSQLESAALWKLYLKSNDGICIQSTVARLRETLDRDPHDVYLGPVNYIDYGSQTFDGEHEGLFRACMHKRREFEHERELRALIWAPNEPPGGLQVPVDPDILIERVHVGPEAPSWVAALLEAIAKRYGLKVPVSHSRLLAHPPY